MDTIPIPSSCQHCNNPTTTKHSIYIYSEPSTKALRYNLGCNQLQTTPSTHPCVICTNSHLIWIRVVYKNITYAFSSCSAQHTQQIIKRYNITKHLQVLSKQESSQRYQLVCTMNVCTDCKKLVTKLDHSYAKISIIINLVDSNNRTYVYRYISFYCTACNTKKLQQQSPQYCFYCYNLCNIVIPTSLSTLTLPLCSNSCYTNVLPVLRDALQHLNLESLITTKCGMCSTLNVSLKCSSCLVTYYCSRVCQLLHWNEHKLICKPITK
jgi:hypothetical protein